MKTIRDSTPTELASYFWQRERRKHFVDSAVFASPVEALRQSHTYKLPYGGNINFRVTVVELSRNETEDLRIHEYMLQDQWMRDRQLTPPSSRLLDLASYCLNVGYFHQLERRDIQQRRYAEWREAGSLTGVVASDMPVVQLRSEISDGRLEIVDGWGRLLPLVALLIEGFEYHPIQIFLAIEV